MKKENNTTAQPDKQKTEIICIQCSDGWDAEGIEQS